MLLNKVLKKIIKNKKKGILFWVTGLSGSGKTTLSKKIKKDISGLYGPTIVVSGDDLRKIFNLNKYEYKDRLLISYKIIKFAKFITDQKINLIFAAVGMMHSIRNGLKKNIKNYLEIYIRANIGEIIKFNKKKIYHKKNVGALVGVSIKPEFPKNPNIIINNNFKKSSDAMAKTLIKKIKDIV